MPSKNQRAVESHPRRLRSLIRCCLVALALLLLGACTGSMFAGGTRSDSDYRTLGTMLDDEGIEVRVYDAIHRGDGPARGAGNYVRVTSFNRVVLLTGEVSSEARKAGIEAIARDVPDVQRVVNELAVTDLRGLGRRSRDTLLTGQVKAALLGVDIPGFAPQRVKVVSVRGNVYLMGLLTQEQAERVAERVARVRGVRKVVKVFEYQPVE